MSLDEKDGSTTINRAPILYVFLMIISKVYKLTNRGFTPTTRLTFLS